MTTPGDSGPTIQRILVGSQLRRLREAANITREAAGYHIRGSESKISRMELGRVSFKERDVDDLLLLYGVSDPAQRDPLVDQARQSSMPGWWHAFDDVVPGWFQTYVGLESAASLIRTYQVQFLPGLLQTESYARSIITSGSPGISEEEMDRRIALRSQRQSLLKRENPLNLWTVLDEAAIRRPIGGTRVMREQLEHLLDLMSLPNVVVQLMPFALGGHAGDGGTFSILRFPEPELPDVIYIEQMISASYLDKQEYVERYAKVMDRLMVDSQPPELTRESLQSLLKEL